MLKIYCLLYSNSSDNFLMCRFTSNLITWCNFISIET